MKKLGEKGCPFTNKEEYWQAAKSHNADFDEIFYYSKRTSDKYCRPGCRNGKKFEDINNFTYFDTIEQATKHGYKPCGSCRPASVALGEAQQNTSVKATAKKQKGKGTNEKTKGRHSAKSSKRERSRKYDESFICLQN